MWSEYVKICVETQKTPNNERILRKKKKKTELEESVSLISGYTTKLQSSEYYGTGTKIDI